MRAEPSQNFLIPGFHPRRQPQDPPESRPDLPLQRRQHPHRHERPALSPGRRLRHAAEQPERHRQHLPLGPKTRIVLFHNF
jgi:hypothetical protein